MQYIKFRVIILVVLIPVISWGQIPDDVELQAIFSDAILEGAEQICSLNQEDIQNCYGIHTSLCKASMSATLNKCTNSVTDYQLRPDVNYYHLSVTNLNQNAICIDVNFTNAVLDSGGTLNESCRD